MTRKKKGETQTIKRNSISSWIMPMKRYRVASIYDKRNDFKLSNCLKYNELLFSSIGSGSGIISMT